MKKSGKFENVSSTHASLLAIVGAYVIYLAYKIFDNYRTGATSMSFAVTLTCTVLMALVGLAIIGYGCYIFFLNWKKLSKAYDEGQAKEAAQKALDDASEPALEAYDDDCPAAGYEDIDDPSDA